MLKQSNFGFKDSYMNSNGIDDAKSLGSQEENIDSDNEKAQVDRDFLGLDDDEVLTKQKKVVKQNKNGVLGAINGVAISGAHENERQMTKVQGFETQALEL